LVFISFLKVYKYFSFYGLFVPLNLRI
jgi:hypothetical protein